ncbi:MAG: hypothetical protein V4725_20110 [Bacteroidota bacterium]
MKAFFLYATILFFSVIGVIITRYFTKSYPTHLVLYRLFIVGEFWTISLFFAANIVSHFAKKLIRAGIFLFTLFSLYDYFSSEPSPSYPLVLECTFFSAIIIYFFYERMKYSTKFPIYLAPSFWIGVGFLIFSTGNFFVFLFSKLLLQDQENRNLFNHIYGFFTILKNVLLCIAVVVAKNFMPPEAPSKTYPALEFDSFNKISHNPNLQT